VNRSLDSFRTLLGRYLLPQWRHVALLAVLLLSGIGVELLNPQILRNFIDMATGGEALPALTRTALLFLGLAFLFQLISVAETYLAENVGLVATNRLRADLLRHCLHLDREFHLQHTPGELIERVDGDVATLGNFFGRFVVQVLGNMLLLAGVLVLLWGIDWRVGLALTTFAAVALLVVNRLRGVGVPHWQAAREASAGLFGFIEERLAGIEDIRASGAASYFHRGLAQRSRELLYLQRRAGLMGSATGNTTVVLFAIGTVVALGLGAYLFRAGAITIGTVYLIFYYTELLNRPIEQITRQMQDLQKAGASIVRVGELLRESSAIADGPGATLPSGSPTVVFDAVTFGYSPGEPILRDVSFMLEPGKVLGLLGRTGSGKTTITRLLLRLYDPQSGRITLDGIDLRRLKLRDLRRQIGMVTQEIQLFHASVRDNLTFFDRAIDDARILAVLHDLGLDGWFAELPNGLDTKLPPGASSLSAGQAQLLAFARVFLHDPRLVILDEASSRLDPATEQHVEHAVARLLRPEGTHRTAIIIAHRLATVQRADQIMILENGRILEHGDRALLVDDPGSRFAALLRNGIEEALA